MAAMEAAVEDRDTSGREERAAGLDGFADTDSSLSKSSTSASPVAASDVRTGERTGDEWPAALPLAGPGEVLASSESRTTRFVLRRCRFFAGAEASTA